MAISALRAVLLALALAAPLLACFPAGKTNAVVTIGSPTYVCIVVNDRYLAMAQPLADQYTRLVLNGSASLFANQGAWCNNKFWFPLGCPQNMPTMQPTIGGAPFTTYYIVSNGVIINYKKTFVSWPLPDSQSPYVMPITTAVISATNGVVNSVYWNDGCFFCPGTQSTTTGTDPACSDASNDCQQCQNNAYDLSTNAVANLTVNGKPLASGTAGMDCGIITDSCFSPPLGSSTVPPQGFCDLGIYIVWTGTDSGGVPFASAGRRFERYRAYAMQSQLPAMQSWSPGGNSIQSPNAHTPTQAPTIFGRRVLEEDATDVVVNLAPI